MLLTITVYCYTVIAFNFFRKFYVSEEDDVVDQKCHDMLTVSESYGIEKKWWNNIVFQCFVFHLYKGVRAGGGIGDEIEPPDGDAYEVYRILFDISFFFFIIVILLAIIQGKILILLRVIMRFSLISLLQVWSLTPSVNSEIN